MYLYLDIETIPSQNPAVREMLAASIEPPGNITKAETIAAWHAEKKPALVEDAWRKTSFDGALGQMVVASVAIDDGEPVAFWHDDWQNNERKTLTDLFDHIDEQYKPSSERPPIFVGHYITEFDLRFIFQRAVILGIRPPRCIPFHAKPWDDRVFDTMTAWAGARGSVSVDKLCRALDLPTKGSEIGEDIDGSKVWDFVRDGRIAEVATYCSADVQRVRALHQRMTFALAA